MIKVTAEEIKIKGMINFLTFLSNIKIKNKIDKNKVRGILFPAIINEKIIKVIIRDKVIINNLLFFVL